MNKSKFERVALSFLYVSALGLLGLLFYSFGLGAFLVALSVCAFVGWLAST